METWIYLASVCGFLGTFLSIIGVIGGIISAILYFVHKAHEENSNVGIHAPWAKYTFIACVISAFLSCFVPSKGTVYAMIAIHYGQEVVNNERVTNITNNSLDLLDAWIDKEREKLKEEK